MVNNFFVPPFANKTAIEWKDLSEDFFMLYSLRIFFITGFYKVDEYEIDHAADQDVFNKKKLFDKESNLE